MYLIYCHTNRIDGMRYVGYTKQTMMQRWAGHVCDAIKHGHTNCFAIAIREHGPDAFDHDVICDGIFDVKDAKHLERHFIEMLGTCGPLGYNMTRCGNGSGPKSVRTRQLISERTCEAMSKIDPSWKDRQREALKDPLTRQKISERTIEAMHEPERYAVFKEQMSTPERRKMISERTHAAMHRPEVRERQLAGIEARKQKRSNA